eukprot:3979269-Heterocapsa_arctica.AAC.1
MESTGGRAPSTLHVQSQGGTEAYDQPNPGDQFDGTLGYEGEGPPRSPAVADEVDKQGSSQHSEYENKHDLW